VKTNAAVELGTANGTKGIIPEPEDTLGWSRIRIQGVKLRKPPMSATVELINDKHLFPNNKGSP
jgi:hypothetical protein